MGKNEKLWLVIMLAAAAVVFAVSCSGSYADGPQGLKVAASIYPIADVFKQVGGERVDVECLVPPWANPHGYEPTPQQAIQASEADLLVLIGQGFDQVFYEMAEACAVGEIMVITEDGRIKEVLLKDADKHENGEGSYGFDPHVWLDPVLIREKIAPMLAERLIGLDPAGASYYKSNLRSFQKDLQELDEEIKNKVEAFNSKDVIVFHSAWNYFCARYGLQEKCIEKFPNQEPSPRDIEAVIALAAETGARAVFAQPQLSSREAEASAEGFGGQVLTLDPLGGEDIEGRQDYISLMRWNLAQLEKGLR